MMKKNYFEGLLLGLLLLLTLTTPALAAEAAPPGEIPTSMVSNEEGLRDVIDYCNDGNSFVVTFQNDITISTLNENLNLTAGNLTILGSGYSLTFTNNTEFALSGSAALTLGSPDTSETTEIKSDVFSHSIFVLEDNASLTMYDGVTLGPSVSTAQSAGVLMLNNSTFTMKGGLITECKNPLFWTGAVFLANNAKFTMEGGEIKDCIGSGGGAVSLYLATPFEPSPENPTFLMTGGTIQTCIDTYVGGGAVYLAHPGGSFIMDGGEILECSAEGTYYGKNLGGGVLLHAGNVELNGGTIQECTADIGGGVFLFEDTFTMKDGFRLFNNTAKNAGADIYFNRSCRLPKAPVGDSRSCGHKITGWFADDEASRWQCPLSAQESVSTQTPVQPGLVEAGTALIAAHGQSQSFTVTTEASPLEGGIITGDGTYEEGENVTVTATANEGYVFKGWKENASNEFIPGAESSYTFVVNDDRDLVAVFEQTFTVTFNSGGGSAVNPQTVIKDTTATKPADPTREGYDFAGWYLGEDEYDFNTPVTADITLMARWSRQGGGSGGGETVYCTLSYDSNGGTRYRDEEYRKNTVVELDKIPVRDGYTFTGWYADKALTQPIDTVKMTRDKTVYAGWTRSYIPEDLNHRDHIAYVYGYHDGMVRPNANVTRAETASMLYRLLTDARREEIETAVIPFHDVTSTNWYAQAIAAMANGGYINGYEDGTFGGDKPITRAEFVAMLVRFIGLEEADCYFTDVSRTFWAYEYIATATAAKWISGYLDGSFGPSRSITRAEAMTIINRVLDRGVNAASNLPDFKLWPDNSADEWFYYEVIEATNDHEYIGSRPSEDWTRVRWQASGSANIP